MGWRVCLLLASWCGLGQAQPDSIQWQAPAACPDRAALWRAVGELVGPAPQHVQGFLAVGRVTRAPNGSFQLDLRITSENGSGTRRVASEDCDNLVNVAAFSIALALNPELAGGGLAPAAPTETGRGPSPAAAVARPAVAAPAPAEGAVISVADSAPRPPRAAPFVVFADVMPVMDTALMPKAAGGLRGGVDARIAEEFRVGVGGEVYLPQSVSVAGGVGGEFFLWALEARACYQFALNSHSPWAAAVCPSFRGGLLRGTGTGVTQPLTQNSPIYGPAISALALVDMGDRLRVATTAGVLFPLQQDTFSLGAGPVHEVPSWSVTLGIGVEFGVF